MKFHRLLAVLVLMGSSSVFALPPKPAKCPDAAAIHSVGITLPNILPNAGQWLVVNGSPHQYGTPESWGLVVTLPRELDKNVAKDFAVQSLDSLSYAAGPQYADALAAYICTYSTNIPFAQVFVLSPPNIA